MVISLKDTFYEKAQALVGIYRDRQIECSRNPNPNRARTLAPARTLAQTLALPLALNLTLASPFTLGARAPSPSTSTRSPASPRDARPPPIHGGYNQRTCPRHM